MSALARSIRMGNSSRSASPSLTAANRVSSVRRHLSASAPMNAKKVGLEEAALELEPPVKYTKNGATRIYTLNRMKAYNALNHEMIKSLSTQLRNWRESDLCSMIIGLGSEKAFCSGGDVKQLVLDLKENKNTAVPFFKDEFELNWLMAKLGKPYVAVMDGITMGGGCGIALPARIRIATSRTHFAMPETKIGYSPDVGVNYYLAQLDGNIGAWLAITGQDVFGRAAYELGLATHYVSTETLQDLIFQLREVEEPSYSKLSSIAAAHAPGVPASGVSSKSNPDGHSAIKGEIRTFLDKAFGQDNIQAVYESLKAAEADESLSEDVKVWAKDQVAHMDLRSPTGMAVALEGYRRTKTAQRLDATLKNDLSMATAFAGSNRATEDFITGVTAVLVTRTRDRPDWAPASLSDEAVTRSAISSAFFNPKSSHLKGKPEINFDPASSSNASSGADSTWGGFRQYGLPSEAEVEGSVKGSQRNSGAFKLTAAELIERVLDARGDTAGPRAKEVEEYTRGVLGRLCEVGKDGYLNWRKE